MHAVILASVQLQNGCCPVRRKEKENKNVRSELVKPEHLKVRLEVKKEKEELE